MSIVHSQSQVVPPSLDVACSHRAWSAAGGSRRRELDPFGVVVHGGRWYVSARDAGTGETRTFRVDRFADVVLGAPAAPRPEGHDVVAAVARSLARVPYAWAVEVRLDAPVDRVRERIPAALAELTADGEGTLLHMRADSLRWVAEVLAGVGCPFAVHAPDELREHVRALGEVLMASAGV